MMISLDGFFEGPNHELNWHHVDAEFNEFAIAQLDEAEMLLFGWKTYELMSSYWPMVTTVKDDPIVAGKMNLMPKLAFSETEQKVDWNNTKLITKNRVAEEIGKLKQQSGKPLLMLGSNNLAVSFIEMGLLDEVRVIVNPVALGAGHSLFVGLTKTLNLKLIRTHEFKSGNVLLCYSK